MALLQPVTGTPGRRGPDLVRRPARRAVGRSAVAAKARVRGSEDRNGIVPDHSAGYGAARTARNPHRPSNGPAASWDSWKPRPGISGLPDAAQRRGLRHSRARRLSRTPAAGNAPGEDGVVRAQADNGPRGPEAGHARGTDHTVSS